MMTAAFEQRPAEGVRIDRFLEDNIEALGLPPTTRRAVLDAKPRGQVMLTGDRTPVLDVDGTLMGVPTPDDDTLRAVRQAGKNSVFVVFGLGMGHVPRAIREYSDLPILVYEPDPGILRTVLEHGPADFGEVQIITTLDDILLAWVKIGIEHLEAVVVHTQGYRNSYRAELAALPESIRQAFQRIGITRNTYDARASDWVSDIVENLALLPGTVPLMSLAKRLVGVPAFIVGAGPSLDRNVALLHEAARKGIVFSVNSSAKALARHGVVPHVLACIESMDSSHLLAELPFIDEVIRAFSLSAAPGIWKCGKGPLLPFHESLPQLEAPLRALLGVPGVSVCGSVSTAVLSAVYALGCSPIVFLGQDLAYTSGRTHAGGTWWEESRATASPETGQMSLEWSDALKKVGHRHGSEPLVEVQAWGGDGTVSSGTTFTGIRAWLEGAATMIAREAPHVTLVNATEGGARLAGYQERRLREVLDDLPEMEISREHIMQLARSARPALSAPQVERWTLNQADLAGRVRRAARRVRKLSAHTMGALRSQNSASVFGAFSALGEAESAMSATVHAAPLVDLWAHEQVTDIVRAAPAAGGVDAHADAESSTLRGVRVAEAVEHAAATLEKRFRRAARSGLSRTTSQSNTERK